MKGLVFTTFYDYCETLHGPEFLDDLIDAAGLQNDGAYTSVGTYSFEDMASLVESFAARTGTAVMTVLENFGAFCFSRWVQRIPHAFASRSLFDILSAVDDFHRAEIKKLYPDAELPSFKVEERTDDVLLLGYHSDKPLSDLARGVIRGVARHLGEQVEIASRSAVTNGKSYVLLTISRVG